MVRVAVDLGARLDDVGSRVSLIRRRDRLEEALEQILVRTMVEADQDAALVEIRRVARLALDEGSVEA